MSAWHVGVDVGGTFTDLVAVERASARHIHLKVSTVPSNPAAGFMAAIAALRLRADLTPGDIDTIFHGTTLATNAIIERRFSRTALVTTQGFRDVLEIGRHWRPDLYDLKATRQRPLVERRLRLEAEERVGADGEVVTPLTENEVARVIEALDETGVDAVAVVFLHSYANSAHEETMVARIREATGGRIYVCASSELSREPREFERTSTTVLNASLMRLIDDYLTRLQAALSAAGEQPRLYITHSNGGALSPASARRRPVSLAQSGPVAGVQACVLLGRALGFQNLIGFDIGGTSTDIALIEDGRPRYANELDVGGMPVRLPTVQVHSIGAGGGSIAAVDEVGSLQVGPRSAGAEPGPAAYGRGGELATVTDAHAVLGRLPASRKLGGFLDLDVAAAGRAVAGTVAGPLRLEIREAAQAVIDVLNAKMEGAVRVLLRERGSDPRTFALVAFGGAGPLHAVELASRLGITAVIVPRYPGTFSALGLLTSDLRHDFSLSRPIRSGDPEATLKLEATYRELEAIARSQLAGEVDLDGPVTRERRCDVRYLGQAYDVGVPLQGGPGSAETWAALQRAFHDEHERAYAFADRTEPCEVRTQRLSVTVPVGSLHRAAAAEAATSVPTEAHEVVIDGRAVSCPILDRAGLSPGSDIPAPCLIFQDDATTYVPPGVSVEVAPTGDLIITGIAAT